VQPRPIRRIFVSRKSATRGRKITNEAEVEGYLQSLGFETILLENLSFGDQVAVFAQAAVVVGSHGAGFTNMLFSPPGLQIVDIFEPLYVQHCFWTMSEALGHRYSYFFGETVPAAGTDADIAVPIRKLAAAIERLGLAQAA
jgi:capsular polysaccharide biosynthesis protein